MNMENRHTRSVRAAREAVAALQAHLAMAAGYAGTIDGMVGAEPWKEAVRGFQASSNLDRTGTLDLATSLLLFGLRETDMRARFGDRWEVDWSPWGAEIAPAPERDFHGGGGDP